VNFIPDRNPGPGLYLSDRSHIKDHPVVLQQDILVASPSCHLTNGRRASPYEMHDIEA